jgi:hypothetical protein
MEVNFHVVNGSHSLRSCPPFKARTIDRPNEFKIRGWSDWLHFDAEVEQLEGAVLDGGELRIEDEVRLRGAADVRRMEANFLL